MSIQQQMYILPMLKALADESRLQLLQVLNEGERTVGDLAERVMLTEPTVSHHLARLREVGLVTLRMAGNQRFYRLNEGGLDKFKQLAAVIEQLSPFIEPPPTDDSWIEALDWGEEDKQVLRDLTSDGKLRRLPSKHKKLIVILRWLASLFKVDTLYTESEVNAILKSVYEYDFVTLRRELVDFGYLRRERGGGKYWLTPTDEAPAT